MRIVSIVGPQNSGKTRLVTRLVRHLARAGWRVGTIKHASHGFDLPGKDSHAHFRAGAHVTALIGPDRTALYQRCRTPTLNAALRHFPDVDVLIIEGFRDWRVPRIEVWRRSVSHAPLGYRVDALVTDDPSESPLPTFGTRDVAAIARFVLSL